VGNVWATTFITSNTDELIHDLAVLISHRGVVFFRDQDITIEQHKSLGQSLLESLQQINYIGTLFLKMSQSWVVKSPSFPLRGMPWSVSGNDVGLRTTCRGIARPGRLTKTRASEGWHSGITFEKVPSDHAVRGLLIDLNTIISPKYTDPQVTHTPSRYVSSLIFVIRQSPTSILVGGDTLIWAQNDHGGHRIDSSFVSGLVFQ